MAGFNWVLVQEFHLLCHNKGPIFFFAIDPYYGNLKYKLLNKNPVKISSSYAATNHQVLFEAKLAVQATFESSVPRPSDIP